MHDTLCGLSHREEFVLELRQVHSGCCYESLLESADLLQKTPV